MFSEYTFTCPPESGVYVERAYAKVNLFLHVGQRRTDGYHDIATLLQTVALHDRVEMNWSGIRQHAAGPLPEVHVTSDDLSLPRGEDNLAGRAVQKLAGAMRRRGLSGGVIRIHITKHIPVAAGLGGGSANAAAVLRGLNRALGLGLTTEQLADLGAEIGSDVPACVHGGTLFCQGRGEKVSAIPSERLWWVLASAGGHLRAGDVYSALDQGVTNEGRGAEFRRKSESLYSRIKKVMISGHPDTLAPFLVNDLQRPVGLLDPKTEELVHRFKQLGIRTALVSGSGPTVAGLVADAMTAKSVAHHMRSATSWVWWGPSIHPGHLCKPFNNRDEATL